MQRKYSNVIRRICFESYLIPKFDVMRIFFFLIISIFIFSCSSENKSTENNTSENNSFATYWNSLEEIEPNTPINPLYGGRSTYDTASFKEHAIYQADWPWGKIKKIDGSYVTVENIFSDFTYPYLVSHDSLGEIQDSIYLARNTFYSENGDGNSVFHYNNEDQFVLNDTIVKWELDSMENEIIGTKKQTSIIKKWILRNGKFRSIYEDTLVANLNYITYDSYKITFDIFPPEPWFSGIKIQYKNKIIYESEKDLEFDFHQKNWSTFTKLSGDSLLILLEKNNRPGPSTFISILFENGKILKTEKMPVFEYTFESHKLIGAYEYSEFVSPTTALYVPYLVYKFDHQTGYELDSATSIEINKKAWGDFHGWENNTNLPLQFNPL